MREHEIGIDGIWNDLSNVFIEITSHCNMHCKFCPSDLITRGRFHMKKEYVIKILRELKNKNSTVHFHILGEPLLNPDFMFYMSICDEYKISVSLTCNLTLMTKPVADKLFSFGGLKELFLSYHTITRESFALRRYNSSYDAYLELLKSVVFLESRLESCIPVHVLVMNDVHCFHDQLWNAFSLSAWEAFLDQLDQWAEELKISRPTLRRCNETDENINLPPEHYINRHDLIPDDTKGCQTYMIFPNLMVTLKNFFLFNKSEKYLQELSQSTDYEFTATPELGEFGCGGGSTGIGILSNGQITACCLDYDGDITLGNIEDMTIEEALKSPIRRQLKDKAHYFSACRRCRGTVTIQPHFQCG